MPMEALLLLGWAGFSSNSVMRLFSSVFRMPKRGASSHGTSRTAMVQIRAVLDVLAQHRVVIHLVDVVAGEHQHVLRILLRR